MPWWKRALTLLRLGEHAEFIWSVLDWLGLTRPINWILYGLGGGISGYFADLANWSPINIFLAVIGAGAGLSVVYGVWHATSKDRKILPLLMTEPELIADIDASVAFFDILAYSEWSKRQTPENEYAVSDWLSRRLDGELHNQLHQGKLAAWGHRCLTPFKESPEGPIPSKEWAEIEIDFSVLPRTCAIWRIKKPNFNVVYAGIRFCSEQIYRVFPLREEIPLFEAAVLAFERTRNNEIAILAHGLTDSSEEGTLTWYCDYMCRYRNGNAPLMKLWGSTPPSREKDEIYIEAYSGYHFAVEGKAIVLQQTQGKSRHENLSVRRMELKAAIAILSNIKVP